VAWRDDVGTTGMVDISYNDHGEMGMRRLCWPPSRLLGELVAVLYTGTNAGRSLWRDQHDHRRIGVLGAPSSSTAIRFVPMLADGMPAGMPHTGVAPRSSQQDGTLTTTNVLGGLMAPMRTVPRDVPSSRHASWGSGRKHVQDDDGTGTGDEAYDEAGRVRQFAPRWHDVCARQTR
jgi:hypothetical protein